MVNSSSSFNVLVKVEESLAYNSDIFNLITTIVMAIGTVGVLVILIYCLIKRRRERLARERSE
jgi:heme/copper-type cytochrome/quinol oxidase subunit 2